MDSGASHALTPCASDVLVWTEIPVNLSVADRRLGRPGRKVIWKSNNAEVRAGVWHPYLTHRLVSVPDLETRGGGFV